MDDAGADLEFTGGMKVAYRNFVLELPGRRFDVTGAQRFSERGVAMTATVNPYMDGTGFTDSISPRWGSDVRLNDMIWQDQMSVAHQNFDGISSKSLSNDSNAQLNAQLGYGWLVANEQFLLTPFVQFASTGDERQQTQFGAHLRQLVLGSSSFSAKLAFGQNLVRHRAPEEFISVSLNMGF